MGDAIYALNCLISQSEKQSKYYKNNQTILDIEKEKIKNFNKHISECQNLLIEQLHNNRI